MISSADTKPLRLTTKSTDAGTYPVKVTPVGADDEVGREDTVGGSLGAADEVGCDDVVGGLLGATDMVGSLELVGDEEGLGVGCEVCDLNNVKNG